MENWRTFAEIKITTHENTIPVGSAIKVSVTGVDTIDSTVHSTNIVFPVIRINMDIGKSTAKIIHMVSLANLLILSVSNMKKSLKHL